MTHDDRDWELTQANLGGHFLQSTAWAKLQSDLGREVVRAAGEGWAYQGVMSSTHGLKYLYCPYGPVLMAGERLEAVVQSWMEVGESLGCGFVRFEPVGGLAERDLEQAAALKVKGASSKNSLVLDLGRNEKELWAGVSADHREAIKAGLHRFSFRPGDVALDGERFFDDYHREMMRVVGAGGMRFCVAEHNGEAAAAAVAFDYNGTRYLAAFAGAPEAKSLQIMVPLVWHLVLEAKASGLREFDFWSGLTEFKRQFGGRERGYLGTWELPLRPWRYGAYAMARKFSQLF